MESARDRAMREHAHCDDVIGELRFWLDTCARMLAGECVRGLEYDAYHESKHLVSLVFVGRIAIHMWLQDNESAGARMRKQFKDWQGGQLRKLMVRGIDYMQTGPESPWKKPRSEKLKL